MEQAMNEEKENIYSVVDAKNTFEDVLIRLQQCLAFQPSQVGIFCTFLFAFSRSSITYSSLLPLF